MKQNILITILIVVSVILAGTTIYFAETNNVQLPPPTIQNERTSYGTFNTFLTGQESITYPLIFDNIRTDSTDKTMPSVIFGPQTIAKDFQIDMVVTKMTRKSAENLKKELLGRGAVSVGTMMTPNNYAGEIIAFDLKAYPDPNTESCSLSYRYFIPLQNSQNDLQLEIGVSEPAWGVKPEVKCALFDEQNYKYFKDMIDKVIDDIQPAF